MIANIFSAENLTKEETAQEQEIKRQLTERVTEIKQLLSHNITPEQEAQEMRLLIII